MINKILKIILMTVLIGLVLEGIYIYYHWPRFSQSVSEGESRIIKEINPSEEEPFSKEVLQPEKTLIIPESLDLSIPFTSQAPFSDWSPPFNHACEEATVLMVHYYLEGKLIIDPAQAKRELLDLVDFEIKNYGFHEDSSAAQTAELIKDYYGYSAEVKYDISLEDIKKELAGGNPVIVPTAGRLLGNPYFTPPGPIYHMLLIKGYNPTEFITHDPGTKRGADFVYSYQILEKAIHDWNKEDIEHSRRAMIVIYPAP